MMFFLCIVLRPHPSTLFPYTTLFRSPIGHMPAYGFAHVTALVAIVALSVAAVAWARRADPGRVGRILRAAGWALLLNSIFWTAWGFMPWAWKIGRASCRGRMWAWVGTTVCGRE